jgi:exonuclease SbcD
MKLFHLSDLHLGKRLKEISLIEDQEYILKKILTAAGSEKPDGILIAGDVYDRSIPSEEAMKLWDDFLVSLAEKKIPVFVVSGNHDSAIRLSDHSELVEAAGIHFSPVYDGTVKRIALEAGGEKVYIHMLPFVKPAIVKSFFPGEEINDYTDACRVALSKADVDSSVTNILMAHQFVTGAERCDSEEVVVGGLDNVNASVFDDFDYVALGHIHGKQYIGRETVRYCGTPLKYSFSEKNHHKSITVVNIKGKEITLDEIPLDPLHDLREIKGTYEELTDKKNYENTDTDDYIHAVLTDENDVIDAMGKLRVIYPNIMQLTYDNTRTKERNEISGVENIEEKTPLELFMELFEKQNNAPMAEEQMKFITECIDKVWEG